MSGLIPIDELQYKQRQLIVHSFIYYELNDNIWTDNQYDGLALEIEAQKPFNTWKESKFYSIFKYWDSSTGISLVKHSEYEYYQHFRRLGQELINYDTLKDKQSTTRRV